MQYHFYAYQSPYGVEYVGDGTPHRFSSRRDRDKWLDECPEHRGTFSCKRFRRQVSAFGWFVDHDAGDLNGVQAVESELEED